MGYLRYESGGFFSEFYGIQIRKLLRMVLSNLHVQSRQLVRLDNPSHAIMNIKKVPQKGKEKNKNKMKRYVNLTYP